jgi:hypothetical protein
LAPFTGRAGEAGRTGDRLGLPWECEAPGADAFRDPWIENAAVELARCDNAALALPGEARKAPSTNVPAKAGRIDRRSGFILSSETPAARRGALTRGYTGVLRRFRAG